MRSGYRTPAFWRWHTDAIVRSSDRRAYVDGRFVRVSLTGRKGGYQGARKAKAIDSELTEEETDFLAIWSG